VRKSLIEEVGALFHHALKVVFSLPRMLPRILKFLLGAAKLVLNALQPLHGTSIRCHLVELAVQSADLLKQLLFKLVIRLLFHGQSVHKMQEP
jgi:hypothetical protein